MEKVTPIIREATHRDIPGMQSVLAQVHLSSADLLAEGTRYWLATDPNENPIGVIGLEIASKAALLRSVAVSPSFQGQGLGNALLKCAFDAAREAGCTYIYLFSTDAGSYWQRMRFHEVPVDELVAALPAVPQVKEYDLQGWLPTEVAWRHDLEK